MTYESAVAAADLLCRKKQKPYHVISLVRTVLCAVEDANRRIDLSGHGNAPALRTPELGPCLRWIPTVKGHEASSEIAYIAISRADMWTRYEIPHDSPRILYSAVLGPKPDAGKAYAPREITCVNCGHPAADGVYCADCIIPTGDYS